MHAKELVIAAGPYLGERPDYWKSWYHRLLDRKSDKLVLSGLDEKRAVSWQGRHVIEHESIPHDVTYIKGLC